MIVLNSSLFSLRSKKKKKVLFTLYSFHPLTNPHGFEKIDVIQAGWGTKWAFALFGQIN